MLTTLTLAIKIDYHFVDGAPSLKKQSFTRKEIVMAVLSPLQGDSRENYTLASAVAIFGRHPSCDIVLASGSVSRRHARISNIDGSCYIEDLNSRNGTYLNHQVLTDRHLLKENDLIGICEFSFVFHLAEPGEIADSFVDAAKNTPQQMPAIIDDERDESSSTIMSQLEVSSVSSGIGLQVNTEAKLHALLEISRNLGRALGLGAVLPKLLDCLFKIFQQADRGFIVLKDRQSGELTPKAVKLREAEDAKTIRISSTIVKNAMSLKQAILSADAAADTRFEKAESIVDFKIRSMICAPLVTSEGEALGVIQIDCLDPRNRFNREDLDVLASVACQAAFAVENAQLHETALREQTLKRDLTLAHQVQRGLLPAAHPIIPHYEFFEFYEPANVLGGDYYDYVELPGGRLAVVLGDVSGKGISAALLMARLSADARYCLASEPTPAAAIAKLNRVFCSSEWEDRFVTLAVAVLAAEANAVTIVNAGHLPPLLCRSKDAIYPVAEEIANLPLGVDSRAVYEQCTIPLQTEDMLVFYTDGITEAMNAEGALYTHQRLMAQLASEADGVGSVGRRIIDDVRKFVGDRQQSDDMCLVCFGRKKSA
ncbi:MAG: SpoIIE family protein phosphatase [Thermoguttaceae bacterium]